MKQIERFKWYRGMVVSTAAVAVVTMVASAPAAADTDAREFSLAVAGNDTALVELAGIDLADFEGSGALAAGADGATVQAAIDRLGYDSRNAWRSMSASMQADDSAGGGAKKRGFGRWLKRRWYIAVLAAVAVGVALDDDSDAGEVEDD